jgi:hypothetical protein
MTHHKTGMNTEKPDPGRLDTLPEGVGGLTADDLKTEQNPKNPLEG